MPRVPTVQGPTVEEAPLRSSAQSLELPTAGMRSNQQAMQTAAQGLGNLGNTLGRIADQRQEQADADMLMRADTALKSEWLEQSRTLRNRNGQDAWGATEDTKKWFDDAVKRNGEGLTNDRQRLMYRKQAESLRMQGLDYAGRHEDEQRKKSVIESSNARIVADINIAAADPTPENLARGRKNIEASIDAVGQLSGMSPEVKAALKQEKLGTLHKQVLQGMLEHSPLGAEEYFKANKAEIPGADQAEIEKTIRHSTIKLKGQTFVDEALKRNVPEADALKMVREKYEGEDEETFSSIVRSRYAEVEAVKNRNQAQAAENVWARIEKGAGLASIPASEWSALDPRTRISIKSHLKSEAERISKGTEAKTDWATYGNLRELAASNPEKFKQLNLVEHFGSLAPREREQLMDLKQSLSKPGKDEKHQEVATLSQQLSNAHDLLQLGGKDGAEKRGRFDSVVTAAVSRATREKGKALTYEERQAVIDRQMIEGTVKGSGWLFDNKKRAYELEPGEVGNFAPKIPDDARAAITKAFAAKGVAKPTDEQITQAFRRAKGL